MVRSGMMKAIFDVLGSHAYLALEDFKVEEFQNKQKEACISIAYRYNPSWQFRFHIPKSKTKLGDSSWEHYWFNCTMLPGRESSEESLNAEERTGVLKEIQEWLVRLYEDIVSVPIVRQFEAHSNVLEQLKDRLDTLPNEPLSRSDVKEFREGLDQVKAEFAEQLKQQMSDKDELRRKVEELGRDIEFLKQTLESMTKRQWSEVFLVRLNKWKERVTLRQIAAGSRVLQMLLPANIAQEMDSVTEAVEKIADIVDEGGNS